MGTRGLTMVIDKAGKTKVAQYGQWNHYPSGQGITALTFLRKKGNINKLEEALKRTRFANKKDKAEREEFFKSIGVNDGWMNMEQGAKFHEKYPLDTRDNGAEILELICKCKDNAIVLINSTNFDKAGIYCEGTFTVNLKENTFEVNCGSDRHKTYSLSKLPTPKKFLKDLKGGRD